jgi:hypothetical protein
MGKENLPWSAQYLETPDIVEDIATEAGVVTYLGFWENNSNNLENVREDRPCFQIRRVTKTITIDGGTTTTVDVTEYAEGSAYFDKVWSQREAYNYSFLK